MFLHRQIASHPGLPAARHNAGVKAFSLQEARSQLMPASRSQVIYLKTTTGVFGHGSAAKLSQEAAEHLWSMLISVLQEHR
jgi:hypothetical protein